MKRHTARKIRNLKNKSIWPHIIKFLVSIVVGFGIVALIFGVIITNIVQNKVNDSLRDAYMVQEYINEQLEAGRSYDEILADIEDMTDHPLAINVVDDTNAIIEMYGDKLITDDNTQPDMVSGVYYVNESDGKTYTTLNISGTKLFKEIFLGLKAGLEEYNAKQYIMQDIYSYEFWVNTEFSEDVQRLIENQLRDSISSIDNSIHTEIGNEFLDDDEEDDDLEDDDLEDDEKDGMSDAYEEESGTEDNHCRVYIKYRQHIYANDILILVVIALISTVIIFLIVVFQFINAISNITYQRSILRLLLKDTVTDGNSMLAFEQFAGRSLRRRKNKSMTMVDFSLLRYQNYCTLYGIEEGERLLTEIDTIIDRKMGAGEMIARTSNADFEILLCNKSSSNYEEESIKRLQQLIDELPVLLKMVKGRRGELPGLNNIAFNAGAYVMGPAVGKAGRLKRRDRSNNIEQLRMKAEIARQGLGGEAGVMIYNHKMWEDELWTQKVEDMMHKALENQEFQVYIQPKYHPSTEQLMGGEALVRWISPTEGFISPGKFIPIFENNGFITKLDDYMIIHTAELQAKWLAAGKKIVPVSVNVSRLHFSQPDLAEHINELVDRYDLPHKYIEIELTESAFFDDKKALLNTVRKLQKFGFAVSMDDFGAGYSSLNSLKDLPLNVLKLDAEFFRGDDFGSRGEIVVSEAISLAKMLNMKIVAEGVEKKEQVDFLAKQNCDMIQGYYFAKPMPADEYESRMSDTGNETVDNIEENNKEECSAEESSIEESVSEEKSVSIAVDKSSSNTEK